MDKERSGGGKRGREVGHDEARTATEDEVEEFFAILRRIRAAARLFKDGRKVMVTEKGPRWRPTFEWEDFAGANGVITEGEEEGEKKGGEKAEEEENGGLELDLNVEPEPEHAALVS